MDLPQAYDEPAHWPNMPPPTAALDDIAERRERCAFALRALDPMLESDAVSVSEDVPGCLAAVWPGGTAWFPQSDQAERSLATQERLLPHLRGFLSPAIPLPAPAAAPPAFGRAWHAAEPLEGVPLAPAMITDKNIDRLVADIARFLMELHGFSVERARSLGAPALSEWRARMEQVSRAGQRAARSRMRISEAGRARRWWQRTLESDRGWQPALIHGALDADRLLIDPLATGLAAVAGWHNARIGDPAWDLSAIVEAYGTEIGWRVISAYGELGATADADLFARVRRLGLVRRFEALAAAEAAGDPEAADAAVEALRRSQLFGG